MPNEAEDELFRPKLTPEAVVSSPDDPTLDADPVIEAGGGPGGGPSGGVPPGGGPPTLCVPLVSELVAVVVDGLDKAES